MNEKFVKETIENYDKIDDRARHIAEMLKIDGQWIDNVTFCEDKISYVFGYTCFGDTNYNYTSLPIKYMWMDDDDVVADYEAERKRKEEEAKRQKELKEEKKRKAQEKAERTMYERLKSKFETE